MAKKKQTKTAARNSLYRRMFLALQEEFRHRCGENKDQRRIDELNELLTDAEGVLYHWKD
jgi:hypothetical protein